MGYIQYDPPINYAAVGAGVGSFVGVTLVILIGLIIYWKKRKRPESGNTCKTFIVKIKNISIALNIK